LIARAWGRRRRPQGRVVRSVERHALLLRVVERAAVVTARLGELRQRGHEDILGQARAGEPVVERRAELPTRDAGRDLRQDDEQVGVAGGAVVPARAPNRITESGRGCVSRTMVATMPRIAASAGSPASGSRVGVVGVVGVVVRVM